MLKKIINGTILLAGALIITSGMHDIESNGAPIASTNAPGETTCNRSGCHTGSPLNSGDGLLSIALEPDHETPIPGAVYDVTVSMAQPGIERFGFQLLALFDDDSSNAGTFVVTDETRTKVLTGNNQYTGRQYMTYKYAGTSPFAPGEGRWNFQWRAPEQMTGPITFYVAAAAANNDVTDDGDLIYTKKLSLGTITSVGSIHVEESINIFPNPVAEEITISYSTAKPSVTSFLMTDVLTHKTDLLLQRNDSPGVQTATIHLPEKYLPGLYLLTVTNVNGNQSFKIILQ